MQLENKISLLLCSAIALRLALQQGVLPQTFHHSCCRELQAMGAAPPASCVRGLRCQ